MSEDQEREYRERSRSRDRDNIDRDERDDWKRDDRNQESNDQQLSNAHEGQSTNLYVRNLSLETTEESLRAAFVHYGEVTAASIVKEPITAVSRGFGFVAYRFLDDADRALEAMINGGAQVDGRTVRIEKARRNVGYEKTPGRYLGPPGMAMKNQNRYSRGPPRDSRDRGHPYDREYRPRSDSRGGGPPPRDFRGPPQGGAYRDDPRDFRGPPLRDHRASGGGGGGGDYRGPAPRYDDYPPVREYLPPPREYGYDDRGYPPPQQQQQQQAYAPRGGGGGGGGVQRGAPPMEYDRRGPPPGRY